MEILAATGNMHKVQELQQLLGPHGVTVISPREVGGVPEVEETGTTFEANAILKAEAIAKATGRLVIADDSGLEVVALGGRPGIRSARYAGEGATREQLMAKVLEEIPADADRAARFVSVIAVAGPDGVVGTAEGEVKGQLTTAPRGDNGFGYDPIFVPDGYQQTFGELGSDVKDQLSHRANAVQAGLAKGLFG